MNSTRGPARLFALALAGGLGAIALLPGTGSAQNADDGLAALGAYDSGDGEGGSEIVAFDAATNQLFTTNGVDDTIDVIDVSDPVSPALVTQLDVSSYGDGIQSVAVGDGVVAAAVKAADDTANGTVVVFSTAGVFVAAYEVGNLPDSIAFTPDGRYIVVANEAEPICTTDGAGDDILLVDPQGSISVIDTDDTDIANAVATADFARFDGTEDALRAAGVRIFFPGSTASQDIEPEYVSISPDGATAYVTLQENNAVAVVDIASAAVTSIVPLGYKNHSLDGNGLDASNRDDAESILPRNVLGMFMPDAIVAPDIGGITYLVTANEGDARDYDCYSEEERVRDFGVTQPPYSATDADDDQLGRLRTTSAFPSTFDGDGQLEQVYAYGARSFTIWSPDGTVVFDSGDDFEQQLLGTDFFNLDDDETDGRSDDKGPEPEALAVGQIDGRTFAFIGLERAGGVMMYDISDPANATFVDYINTAEAADPGAAALVTGGGDVSPEGIVFIGASNSPTGEPLLAVSFEVSGTTRMFQVNVAPATIATTTTVPTTTTAPTTTSPSVDTTTIPTVPAATTAPTSPTPAGDPVTELPATGSSNSNTLWIAAAPVSFGAVAMRFTRRRIGA